jgi:acetyl-CoA C-acetyltransferase
MQRARPVRTARNTMSLRGKAYIAGAFEHPTRLAPDKSVTQLHAECAAGALRDAGLDFADVDGYFCAGDAPGGGPLSMAEYLNLRLSWADSTELGGCSYLAHIGHAAAAIAAGHCSVALITMAGKPRSAGQAVGRTPRQLGPERPETPWDAPYRWTIAGMYALYAMRHMHEFGTTPEQLAWVKVAASRHAQHNPNALLRKPVTVEDVLASPLIAPPLHRLDCCVITDGGGALVLVRPEIARSLARPLVKVRGCGETVKTSSGGYIDATRTGAERSGAAAFAEAGLSPADIKYASIYDNFTIMVLMQLEDLGFCAKGEGGRFAADGNLISGVGALPFNTDGGGLCNNHPQNRGGITKAIEAVRQLRGEAHPAVQVRNCDLALACGPGLVLGDGHAHATVILERE